MSFYLFYGTLQDFFKEYSMEAFSRYRILLPVQACIVLGSIFYYRRSKRSPVRFSFYLNCLLILFILWDVAVLSYKTAVNWKEPPVYISKYDSLGLALCNDCPRPDIFLVVLDEYSGSLTLKEKFRYDNTPFENVLRAKGFFVAARPFSNYSATSISMASLLEMRYNTWMEDRKSVEVDDYTKAADAIASSASFQYLLRMGYRLYNYSIFDLHHQPSSFNTGLLKVKLQLITDKTLFSRMQKDLSWHLHGKVASQWNWLATIFQNNFKEGNERLLQYTYQEAARKDSIPKFVYTHLMMPHSPFLYDSMGKEVNKNFFDLSMARNEREAAYIQYLVYTNRIIEKLVVAIQEKTNKKAVIIVMSDHGFRTWSLNPSCFEVKNNLNAVYLPSGNYQLFYDSVSNVNQFRILFNSLFDQKLELLTDSCVN